jgi:hypothetical protein
MKAIVERSFEIDHLGQPAYEKKMPHILPFREISWEVEEEKEKLIPS